MAAPTIADLSKLTSVVENRVADVSDVRFVLPLLEDLSDILPSCAADLLSRCFAISFTSGEGGLQATVADRLMRADCVSLSEDADVVEPTRDSLKIAVLMARQLKIVRDLGESAAFLRGGVMGPFQSTNQLQRRCQESIQAMRDFCAELDSIIDDGRGNASSVGMVLAAMDGKAKTLIQSAVAVKIAGRDEHLADELLRASTEAYRKRLDYALEVAPDQAAATAAELLAVLRALSDAEGENALREFLAASNELSHEVARDLEPAAHIEELTKRFEAMPGEPRESYADALSVTSLTETVMRQYEIPEDRRLNVAAEVRSALQMQAEQQSFCRHIAVTMDLSDRHDPELAWTSPAEFKGYCQLKQIETNLSSGDAQA